MQNEHTLAVCSAGVSPAEFELGFALAGGDAGVTKHFFTASLPALRIADVLPAIQDLK
jgi:hypothetical protein